MSRRKSWIDEIENQEYIKEDEDKYKKPIIGQEKKIIIVNKDGYSDIEFKNEIKDLNESMLEDGYILINNIRHIEKIFGKQTKKSLDQKRTGRRYYFVWRLSGYVDFTIKQSEKNDYLDSLGINNERAIMQVISQHNLVANTYLVDETGTIQLTQKDGRMRKKDAKGKALYSRDSNSGKCFPTWRKVTIDDCPLTMIQEVVKVEDLKIKSKKKA